MDTASGPLSALSGTSGVETESGMRYEALLWGESGEVRLLNAGGAPAEVRLSGTDDAGSSGGAVELALAPWSARTLTATALAEGEAGMLGALGAGSGSWRLRLEADREIDVLSLVRGSGGMLSDVSRRGRPAGAPPRTEVIDATARGRPDLWVAASASEAELSPGEAFELAATVGNRGGEASATTLRYHRSADASITAADAEVGADAVAALAAGEISAESLTLNAPTAPGTYYYGACADAVAEETNTANNCSTGVAVTVREPPAQPDLEVRASASEAELSPGEAFELTATVGNRGGDASATTLRYYRSADASITAGDAEAGTDAVAELAAGATSAESLTLNAPTAPGTYYYGACADAVAEETNTSNNCSAAVAVKVTEPPRQPDLAVTATPSYAALEPGASFSLAAAVRNRGGADARATTLRYYRSTDATITTSDTEEGTDAVDELAASGSSAESIALTAPSTSGIYYYGACVDAVPDEYDTTNNCSSSVEIRIAVPVTHPNLAVASPAVSDARPDPGVTFTFSATVRNLGDSASTSSTLRYYRSSDATVSSADTQVDTDPVTSLGTAGSSPESATLMAPSTSGTYYYGACVDPVEGESDTADNCSEAVEVTVLAVPPGPDLVVSASTDHPVVGIGADVLVEAEVRNRGGADASKTYLRWFLSDNNETPMSWSGFQAIASVPSLEVGRSATLEQSFAALRRPGTYYLIACAEAVPDESDTSNNCSAAEVTIRALAPPPDLTVTVAGAWDGDGALTLTVTNVGTGRSAGTMLGIYCTVDLGEPHPGQELRWGPIQTVPPLEPGESMIFERKDVSVPHELYAWVQPVVGEMDIDNNVSGVFRQ